MLAHTKEPHTRAYIDVKIVIPSGKKISYHVPNTATNRQQLSVFFENLAQTEITPWNESTPWEVLAKDRIEKYKKAGLVLRGARYREGLSQIALAAKSGIHQNEISKIENGKRGVGEKVAKKLAKALKFDYRLLLVI